MIFSLKLTRRETIRESSCPTSPANKAFYEPRNVLAMSRLFVRTAELAQWVTCEEAVAAPVRYRLVGQLVEVITTGHACELLIRDLAEFGNGESQEGIRAVVGDRVYESRFVANVRSKREVPRPGCAVDVCVGVVLGEDGSRMLEVLELEVLKRREIEALCSFVRSSEGDELIKS